MAEIEGGRIEEGAVVIEMEDIIDAMYRQAEVDKNISAEEKREILDALNKVKAIGKRMK